MLEPGLAELMLADVGREPGTPRMRQQGQHQTWERRRGSLLQLACVLAGRNLTQTEWTTYFYDEPYRVICSQ